ncbi:hypothetical protein RQP46_005342 [Phenoliferia psychrophenolica]
MQSCPTYFDRHDCSVGVRRGDYWGYDSEVVSYYSTPSLYPGPLFEQPQPQLATTLSPFVPAATMPGFNPHAPSPTRQYLLSPITPTPSSFPQYAPPPMRAASPIYSVPPSLISDSASSPLSPILSYYSDPTAYPSPGLSLVGNSLVGLGCDSPVSDTLDFEAPYNISRGWSDVTMASLRLQDAINMSQPSASYQGWVEHFPTPPPPAPCQMSGSPALLPTPPRAIPRSRDTSWRHAPSKSGTPFDSAHLSIFFGRFEQLCCIVDSAGKVHDLSPGLTPPAFEYDLAMREWICYRRNYISIAIGLTCPTNQRTQLFTADPSKTAHSSPITSFSISIDSRSHPSATPVVLLQFDPSRKLRLARPVDPQLIQLGLSSSPNSPSATQHAYSTPPSSSSSSSSSAFVPTRERRSSATFTRLQYRSATANNGKQSHTQERYIAIVRLDAVRADGTMEEVGRWTSKPFIVRGRSPKNFTAARRKEARLDRASKSGANSRAPKRKREDVDSTDEEDDIYRTSLRDVGTLESGAECGRSKRVRRSAEKATAKLKMETPSDSDAEFELHDISNSSEDDEEYCEV